MIRIVYTGGAVAASTATSLSVTIPADTVPSNSFIMCVHCNDFGTLAGMPAPSGTITASNWGLIGSADGGTNNGHIKVWRCAVASASSAAVTVTVTNAGAYACSMHLMVVTRATLSVTASDWTDYPALPVQSNYTPTGTSLQGGRFLTLQYDAINVRAWVTKGPTTMTIPGMVIPEQRSGSFMSGGFAYFLTYRPASMGTITYTWSPNSQYGYVDFVIKGDPYREPGAAYLTHFPD